MLGLRVGSRVAAMSAIALTATSLGAQSVRDSAGVQIVTSERPMLPAARAWRIEPVPMLRMGGNEDAPYDSLYEFNLVMGVARMQDGRWAVGVQGSHTIRFYSADGKFVSSAGRKGQGPGEFEQILGMSLTRGDTLVITDLNEVEYFDGQGRYLGVGASQRNVSRGGYVWPFGMLPGREYVGYHRLQGEVGSDGVHRLPLTRVSQNPARADTVAIVPVAVYQPGVDTRYSGSLVFSPAASVTTGPRGFWFGFGSAYEVSEYDLTNRLVRLVRRSFTRQPVRQAERAGYVAHARAARERDKMHPLTPAMREAMDRALANVPFPREFPAFASIKADRAGNLWVQQYDWHFELKEPGLVRVQTMAAPAKWDVFDSAGRWLCTVDLPARFTPLEIGDDYVAGMSRDEDGVERVDIYRLRKP